MKYCIFLALFPVKQTTMACKSEQKLGTRWSCLTDGVFLLLLCFVSPIPRLSYEICEAQYSIVIFVFLVLVFHFFYLLLSVVSSVYLLCSIFFRFLIFRFFTAINLSLFFHVFVETALVLRSSMSSKKLTTTLGTQPDHFMGRLPRHIQTCVSIYQRCLKQNRPTKLPRHIRTCVSISQRCLKQNQPTKPCFVCHEPPFILFAARRVTANNRDFVHEAIATRLASKLCGNRINRRVERLVTQCSSTMHRRAS